ncbi:MAG: iron-sulfur cluster assembly scaffold protein, partial [Candidatus Gracilibacteria bacterium]|nr:iron-sulfur cluster assembly scaffold protein [Candidatus Gracilibacteria bacterium]
MTQLYSDTFLEYAKNPPNRGILEDPTVKYFEENRSCGDSLTVYLKISMLGKIADFSFTGNTAIVTTACVSILGEVILGMDIEDILKMDYTAIREMIGFDVSPRRKSASVLGLLAIRN